ncbi:MAG: fumarylacetoacetate hydrolase family protein [Vicinamibacterales bacterium]|nr:fumarylacetoacetate hydrolase family protein [Vicinamibacterales bacterium]
MKLARFTVGGQPQIGVVVDDQIFPLALLVPQAPRTIREVLVAGAELRGRITAALTKATGGLSLSSVKLEAPIPDPQKYLAIGMNYADHVEEARKGGVTAPKTQIWFNKQVSCITGPFDPVDYPRVSTMVDYEAELGVVIGKRCRHVSATDAKDVIGGYFVANDVTARDWQFQSPTITLGKSFDTHGPIGPWIVTADEIADPHALDLRLYVNGTLRQNGNTRDMIYNIYAQIEHLTKVMTLEPGDLLATGTCAGVGIAGGADGMLKVGDVVRVEIASIGHIENRVVAEAAA